MKRWMLGCVLFVIGLSSGESAQASDWVRRLFDGNRMSCPDTESQWSPSQQATPQRQGPSQSLDPKFLPRGRAYYGNRYFGNFNNRYYGPQYGYF